MNCVGPDGELLTFMQGWIEQGKGFGYRVSSTGKHYQIWRLEQLGNSLEIRATEIHYHCDEHLDAAREWQSLSGARYASINKTVAFLVAETGDQF